MALDVHISKTIKAGPREGLYSTPSRSGPEGASQTFYKGAPLIYSSGYLTVAAADVTSGIVGFATENGHNDAADGTHQVGYIPALPHIVFQGILEDQTNFLHALVATNMGVKYALQTDTASKAWFLDENDTGNGTALIIQFLDPIGTVQARVLFMVDISATIYG